MATGDRRPLSSLHRRGIGAGGDHSQAAPRGRFAHLNEIAFTASVILWTIRSASSVPWRPFRRWPFGPRRSRDRRECNVGFAAGRFRSSSQAGQGLVKQLENSDVSPVVWLVAVAVTA